MFTGSSDSRQPLRICEFSAIALLLHRSIIFKKKNIILYSYLYLFLIVHQDTTVIYTSKGHPFHALYAVDIKRVSSALWEVFFLSCWMPNHLIIYTSILRFVCVHMCASVFKNHDLCFISPCQNIPHSRGWYGPLIEDLLQMVE